MRIAKIILSILIIFWGAVYLQLRVGEFNHTLFDVCQFFVVAATVVFFTASQKNGGKGHWLKPSYLFVLGYLAVNLQYLLDLRLGIKTISSIRIIRDAVLNHCTVLAVLGVLAFVVGYMWKPLSNVDKTNECKNVQLNTLPQKIPSILVVTQFILFVVFIMTADIASFISGEDYGTDSTSNAESLLYVVNSLIVLLVSSETQPNMSIMSYLKKFPILSIVVFITYILLRLMSGDRGPFVYSVLLVAFGFLYATRRKMRFVSVAGILLGGTILISLVGIARNLDTGISFGGRMSDAYKQFSTEGRFSNGEESIFRFTDELGYSFYVNQVDVHGIVVEGDGFHYLSYPCYGLLSGIPFMPSFIQNTLGVSPKDFSSGGYANYKFFGGYDRTWGIGTTIIGDFYLSFGMIGVIVGLFLTGLLFRYLDNALLIKRKGKMSLIELLFVLLYSSKAIYMARATIFLEMPRFIWGLIILFLFSFITGFKLTRKTEQ